jgi:hypothetical protein
MPSAWKVIVRKRPTEIGGPSAREVYLVALPEKAAAVAVLRMREGFDDADPDPSIEGLDIKPGQVLCVSAIDR